MTPALAQIVFSASPLPISAPRRTVTPREAEILAMLAKGLREKEIAHQLGLSARTIECHVLNARASIGAKTIAHATAMWASGALEVRAP